MRRGGLADAGMIFFRLTSWELGLLFFAVILGATGLGVFLGHRVRHLSESLKEPFGVLQAALLGLVGLLLAFGLSLAVSRYEDRRSNIVTEANAIGTTYLRAQTLAEPVRSRSLDLLVRYTRSAIRALGRGAGQRRGRRRPRTGGADRAPALEPRRRRARHGADRQRAAPLRRVAQRDVRRRRPHASPPSATGSRPPSWCSRCSAPPSRSGCSPPTWRSSEGACSRSCSRRRSSPSCCS